MYHLTIKNSVPIVLCFFFLLSSQALTAQWTTDTLSQGRCFPGAVTVGDTVFIAEH